MLELIILNNIIKDHLGNTKMITRYNELYNEFIAQYYASNYDLKKY